MTQSWHLSEAIYLNAISLTKVKIVSTKRQRDSECINIPPVLRLQTTGQDFITEHELMLHVACVNYL